MRQSYLIILIILINLIILIIFFIREAFIYVLAEFVR